MTLPLVTINSDDADNPMRRLRYLWLPADFIDCTAPSRVAGESMLSYALIFFVIAAAAGAFGFFGLAGAAVGIAKIVFFVFLVAFVVSLVFGRTRAL
jgi:uncharacterized membrane protein YtjA (UPF0391 family)